MKSVEKKRLQTFKSTTSTLPGRKASQSVWNFKKFVYLWQNLLGQTIAIDS